MQSGLRWTLKGKHQSCASSHFSEFPLNVRLPIPCLTTFSANPLQPCLLSLLLYPFICCRHGVERREAPHRSALRRASLHERTSGSRSRSRLGWAWNSQHSIQEQEHCPSGTIHCTREITERLGENSYFSVIHVFRFFSENLQFFGAPANPPEIALMWPTSLITPMYPAMQIASQPDPEN